MTTLHLTSSFALGRSGRIEAFALVGGPGRWPAPVDTGDFAIAPKTWRPNTEATSLARPGARQPVDRLW